MIARKAVEKEKCKVSKYPIHNGPVLHKSLRAICCNFTLLSRTYLFYDSENGKDLGV